MIVTRCIMSEKKLSNLLLPVKKLLFPFVYVEKKEKVY